VSSAFARALKLPLEQRYPLSVLLAVRYWEPALFKALRRR